MVSIDRRTFLGVAGASVLGASSGCLGRAAVVPLRETDLDGVGMLPLNVQEDAHIVTTHVVGHRGPDDVFAGKPVGLVVANQTGSAAEMSISIERRDLLSWTSLYDGRHSLAANARIDFVLRDPATYRIRVSTPTHEGETEIANSEFDCNEKAFSLVATDEGIDHSSISTTMGCGL
ncbi:hypothetical protein C455_03659 [Haloferax larsenii JCM 13917]|nr:hypothetical protein [Haloferax larsenii]ELZ82273.1 hypothetical protein C455_03659 [Haloferax larsenii JCM 13917]